MRAWQISEYGAAEVFKHVNLPDPQPKKGWILIDTKAFGINRSELYTRQGHSGDAVTIPRVLGIECVGIVLNGGGTDLYPGQKVATAMGSMGRKFDGGYAEKTLVPRSNVFPIETNLEWDVLGSIPETYLTAWGAVKEAIDLQPDDTILIRGGTSSVGMACASIAKQMGCTVLATTRNQEKARVLLKDAGIDHVLIDSGSVEQQVKDICPEGVQGVVELVGFEHTIMDSLRSTAPKGTVCIIGFLGDSWNYKFFPWMPSTVKLTIYSSETLKAETTTPVLQSIIERVEKGLYLPNIYRVFDFDDLPDAHRMMEKNQAIGKLVVTT